MRESRAGKGKASRKRGFFFLGGRHVRSYAKASRSRFARPQLASTLKIQSQQENVMIDAGPQSTFRGLPLTVEQDAEVKHYITDRTRRGLPWDTPELSAMLEDMLHPPSDGDDDVASPADEARAAAERAEASIDDAMDPIEANEEWNAAMESEAMKGPRR